MLVQIIGTAPQLNRLTIKDCKYYDKEGKLNIVVQRDTYINASGLFLNSLCITDSFIYFNVNTYNLYFKLCTKEDTFNYYKFYCLPDSTFKAIICSQKEYEIEKRNDNYTTLCIEHEKLHLFNV
jgi:hypothetical protein